VVCNYDRLSTKLHFHHVDPSQKLFDVNPSKGKALAKYQAEARKCVLVCANCHYEIEAGLVPCPPLTACWPEAECIGALKALPPPAPSEEPADRLFD
jgi:cytochrome c553